MILRIVQLPITPGTPEGNDFEQLFDAFKEKIAAAPGCYSLQLLKAQQCYFTYSRWEKESWLEAYRNSPLFEEVWPKTKAFFNGPPQVWTCDELFDSTK